MNISYIKNVTTLKLDSEKCIGCGMCKNVCPHQVFQIQEKKALIINKDLCMECGACKKNCPVNAINVSEGTGCMGALIMSKITGKPLEC
jgi:NAD-dependent dihydropyrimidine dehydrogenase PreA subunit